MLLPANDPKNIPSLNNLIALLAPQTTQPQEFWVHTIGSDQRIKRGSKTSNDTTKFKWWILKNDTPARIEDKETMVAEILMLYPMYANPIPDAQVAAGGDGAPLLDDDAGKEDRAVDVAYNRRDDAGPSSGRRIKRSRPQSMDEQNTGRSSLSNATDLNIDLHKSFTAVLSDAIYKALGAAVPTAVTEALQEIMPAQVTPMVDAAVQHSPPPHLDNPQVPHPDGNLPQENPVPWLVDGDGDPHHPDDDALARILLNPVNEDSTQQSFSLDLHALNNTLAMLEGGVTSPRM